jgi:hypothetical protein
MFEDDFEVELGSLVEYGGDPWERWEDADTTTLDESGYFRELGRRAAQWELEHDGVN